MIQMSSAAGKGTRAAGVAIVVLAGLGRSAATLGANAAPPPASVEADSVGAPPRDAARATALWRQACESGSDEACLRLALLEDAQANPRADPKADWRSMSTLVEQLESSDWRVRAEAASALAHLGPRGRAAIPDLVRSLGDPQSAVRWNAAVALSLIGPPPTSRAQDAVRRALVAVLGLPADRLAAAHTAHAVARALGAYGTAAVPDLVRILQVDDPLSRGAAARALGTIGPPALDAVPALVAAARASETTKAGRLGLEAAAALARVSPTAAEPFTPLLERVLSQKGWQTRERLQAAEALALTTRPRAGIGFLARTVRDRKTSPDEVLLALSLLGAIGPRAREQALPALAEVLRRGDVEVRDAATAALKRIAPQEGTRLLSELRDSERARALATRPMPGGRVGRLIRELQKGTAEQRVRAADALRDPAAIPWLIQSLGDGELVTLPSEDFPRYATPGGAAAESLGAIGLPALEPLATVLADGAVPEQHQAIIALIRIGGTRGGELLAQVLVDPNRDLGVRVLAARSLAQFHTPAVADRLASVLDTPGLGLEAAVALSALGDHRGASVLTQMLQSGDTVDPFARSQAALALSKTPDAAGLDLLLTRARAACTAGHFLPAHMECGSVAKALATLRDPRAVPVLIDALESVGLSDLCAWDLSVALHAVGAPARQALTEALAADSVPRRRVAIEALRAAAQMGDRQGAEALLARVTADPDPELRRQALYALDSCGPAAYLEGARQALDDPETRLPALRALGDYRYKKEAHQVPFLDAALRQLDDADARVVAAAAAVFRSVSGEDKGMEPSLWRAWWAATRPVWLREQAFGSRVLRLEGRLVDAELQPVPGKLVAVCHQDGMRIGARGNGASGCGQDPFGTLAFLFDGDDLVNPSAETAIDGRFSIVDSGRFLSAGERFSAFWFDGARCHRLAVRQQPWFAITIDDDVIDLGDLSLTEKPESPPAAVK